MRTTRRPEYPPTRPRPKGSSSSTPQDSRWSAESASSESSNRSFDRFDDAKERNITAVEHDKFSETPLAQRNKATVERTERRAGINLSPPEKLPGAVGLKRSPAIRLGISGKKTSLKELSQTTETRGRGRTRAPPFAVDVLEFGKTKIHMIKTGAKGSFGEYFIGVDDKGKLFGIKELRSKYEVDDLALEGKKPDTQATLRIQANREVNDTKRFVPQLEASDLVVGRDKKPYIIMKPMDGTVDELLYNVAPEHRRLMGRTALCALAEHAAEIHRKGGIHGDLKTPNALWSAEGLMCAADCGMTSRTPTNTVMRGTYLSPEMIEGRDPYNHKADTWSLMVSLVASYNPNGGDGAFTGKSVKEIQNNLIGFSAWRRFHLGGQVPKEWHAFLRNNPFDKLFRPLLEEDPILAEYILRHGLDPFPETRVSCAQVAQDLLYMGHGVREQARGLEMLSSMPTDPMVEKKKSYLQNLVAPQTR